jgi:RNA 2',3'-cyclic 3'-phosphodiesterase
VTLRFFGEVPEERLSELTEGIQAATSAAAPVESALEDIGAFPNTRRARVLWVGVADAGAALQALASSIEQRCGYPPEDRFKAHLTLARFKVPESVGKVIERHSPFQWDRTPFVIDRTTLYRSVLRRQGAEYTPLAEFPLART